LGLKITIILHSIIIIMNDTMSLLFATSILAIGGLGLYMFKTDDESDESSRNDTATLFGWRLDDKDDTNDYDEKETYNDNDNDKDNDKDDDLVNNYDYDYEEYKPRKRTTTSRGKTQRNRRMSASSRRRY
jgi:hypothetical protein